MVDINKAKAKHLDKILVQMIEDDKDPLNEIFVKEEISFRAIQQNNPFYIFWYHLISFLSIISIVFWCFFMAYGLG